MRKAILSVMTVLLAVAPTAQTGLPPPAQAMFMTAAEMRAIIKAYPANGDSYQQNTSAKAINAGKHVVDIWLEQRVPGAGGGNGPEIGTVHSEVTEIYYVFSGTATMVTGGKLTAPKQSTPSAFSGGAKFLSLTFRGPFEGGVERKIGPGDIVVLPPGTLHYLKFVDPPGLIYFNTRIDPEHKQPAPFVNPALKK